MKQFQYIKNNKIRYADDEYYVSDCYYCDRWTGTEETYEYFNDEGLEIKKEQYLEKINSIKNRNHLMKELNK